MVGRAVAGEAEDQEIAAADLAELLHSARSPAHYRRSLQSELLNQIVGRLGGAGERSGKDFRVREDESFPRTRKIKKRLHRLGIDLTIVDVAGVQAIDQKYSVDAIGAIAQDCANGAISGAESTQIHTIDLDPRSNLIDERIERGRIAEC